ncbi:slipin family protein, partial [Candidatus Daviesbacteria bacterium]|nr:slipin family protein [Candidatus Daviesbacteria bacterium]
MEMVFLIPLILIFLYSIKQVNQYERGVKFRFGKYVGLMEPGWRLVWPVIESWTRIDIR